MMILELLKENWFLCTIGGFMVHLVLGTLYLWGIITVAITSYLKSFNPEITYNDTILVYGIALGVQGGTYILGGVITEYIGARNTVLLGGYILALGIFLTSFATTLSTVIVTYGVMFGIGLGFCYVPPIGCASAWKPSRKGLITGVIVAGFGGGAFVFQFVTTFILHQGIITAEDKVRNQLVDGYYSADSNIVKNVPRMFTVLSILYFILVTLGACLIRDKRHYEGAVHLSHHSVSSQQLPRHWKDSVSSPRGGGGGEVQARDSNRNSNNIDDNMIISSSNHSNYQQQQQSEQSSYQTRHNSKNSTTTATANDHIIYSPLLQSAPLLSSASTITNESNNIIRISPSKNPNSQNTSSLSSLRVPIRRKTNTNENIDDDDININIDDEDDDYDNQKGVRLELDVGPIEMMKMPLAWHLISCFISTTIGGMFLLGMFKVYGVAVLGGTYEVYLSQLGGVASLLNALGRIAWGELGDILGPIETLMIMSSFFSVVLLTYPLSPLVEGVFGFSLWTVLVFICEGGNFALYMPCVIQLFGLSHSSTNFGVVATLYALSNVINISILSHAKVSFTVACHLMGGLTLIGFFNVCLLRYHVAYSKYPHQPNSSDS